LLDPPCCRAVRRKRRRPGDRSSSASRPHAGVAALVGGRCVG
jgi:hypothetical protein